MDDIVGEVNSAPIRFSIFTRQWDPVERDFRPSALKAFTDADGRRKLSGIASSTVKDLHGDTMLASALEDMERAANNNLTIFGNHEYKVPEDVYGSVTKAAMRPAGIVDGNGDPIYDLDFEIAVNEANERAIKTWEAIDRKTKLGLSIGAMIPEGGAVRNKKSGAYTIAHVELLETSVVGIPANPRSWVQNAVKSLLDTRKGATTVPLGAPELTLDTDEGTYQIKGSLADVGLISVKQKDGTTLGVDEANIPEDAILVTRHAECGAEIDGAFPDGICSKCGSTGPFNGEWVVRDASTTTDASATPEVADAATCPTCGKAGPNTSCRDKWHERADASVEPDVTDAKVTLIQIDTDSPSGSSSSEPDGDEGDGEIMDSATAETVDAVKAALNGLEGPIAGTIQSLLTLTDGLLRELALSKQKEQAAVAAKAQAEQERDAVVKNATTLIGRTNDLIKRLGDLRVGPKAVVKEAQDEMDDLRGIYSASFLDMLKTKEGPK